MRLILILSFFLAINPVHSQDTIVDIDMPEFPGGEAGMYEFLGKNLITPVEIKNLVNYNSLTFVSFVVDSTGVIRDAKVLKTDCDVCATAAINLVNKMPVWKPGKKNGVPASISYNLPIRFVVNPVKENNTVPFGRKNTVPARNQPNAEAQQLIEKGNYEDAIKKLKVAYRGDPNNHAIHLQMGLAKLGLEKVEAACKSFTKAKDLGNEEAAGFIKRHCAANE